MTEQPKSKLMARLRARREREGKVRVGVEVWVLAEKADEIREKLLTYAKRLANGSNEGRKNG